MVAGTEEGRDSAVTAAATAVIRDTGGWRIWLTLTVVTSHSWRRTEGGMFETIVSGILLCYLMA